MPRKGQRIKHRKTSVYKGKGYTPTQKLDPLAHNRLLRYMEEHFEWMLVTGYSTVTVHNRRHAIRRFIAWADERGLGDPREITRPILERYQRYLFYYRKEDGGPMSTTMQGQCLAALKTWFKWLSRQNHILANPAADIDLPRLPKRLPGWVPSVEEVEAILREAEPESPQGIRDRALLETLYATGLRRMELPQVAIYDADLSRGILWVRHGKGGRQRVVPLGDRACAWLDKYIIEARPQLIAQDTEILFLTDYGDPLAPDYVAAKVKRYMRFAGIDRPGSTHLLRHACATHMLEGGADIRFIQAMLGHACIQTTEVYTHVSIHKLVAVHKNSHPSRLQRKPAESGQPSAAGSETLTALLDGLD
jgi:integrase/recombinase XerD